MSESERSKSGIEDKGRDLFKRRFYMIFTITLFSVFTLLFFAATATPASAKVSYDYNAWDKVSNSWVTGNLAGYNESECIPSYLNVTNEGDYPEDLNLTLYFDYQDDSGTLGIIGYECCAGCSQCPTTPPDCCIGGADLSTCAEEGTITGPVYYDQSPQVIQYAYYWNFTIPADTTITQCWCARLSDEAALYPGASLHMDVVAPGTGTCSIPTKDLGAPDLYATKTATVTCDAINYTINYGNSGEADQTGTTLVDDYDETNVTVKDDGGGADNGSAITWIIGTLAAGASGSKNYNVSINQGVANGAEIENNGNISGDLAERITTNNTYSVTSNAKVSPVANFTSDSPQIYCHNITFTDTTTGGTTPYNWSWDFDDGNSSTEQNPSYHYSAPGTYNVTLNVTDVNNCMNSTTKQVEVTIAPSISVNKTASPTAGAPSTNVNFTINVTNTGDCTLDPVKVVDTLPTGMSYVAAGTSPLPSSVVGNTITWNNVGPLNSAASTTITLIAHIDSGASGTLTDLVNVTGTPPAGDNVTDSDTADVTTLAPEISVNKTANPTAGAPSTNVNFTINVTNTGDCTLNPVKVVDTLPTGMSYVAAGTSPLPSSVVGNTITWNNVGPLNAGASTLITLIAHIDSGASGTLTDLVNVTGTPPAGDNVTDSDTADVTTLVPEISVNKTANPTAGAPSTNVNFTINVTNTGDCTLNPVKVVDTLPTGMSYVAAGTSPLPSSVVGNNITWNNVGPLNAGASTLITLIAHIDSGASGTLTDLVNVTGTPPAGDNVTDSDTADVTTLVPEISVNKTANPTAGAPSTNVNFTINVTNTGDCTLNPVKVVDTLPAGMSYVVAGTSPLPSSVVGNNITWNNVGPLNAGASTLITLIAHIDSGASGTLTDLVNVTGTPPAGDNVTDSDTADVTTLVPEISVNKTANPTAGAPSTNVNFTINVTNTGDCTLNPVKVVDTLPAGMSYVVAGTSPLPSSVVGNNITWNNVGPLNAGASTLITLIAHIDSGASGTLTDLVNVTGTPPAGDNVTDSDTADVTTLVPEISVNKTANPTAGAPSTNVNFTINVTNTGDCTLNPVKVVDTLPAGMSYVVAGTSPLPSSVVGNNITWNNVGPLNAGASTLITLIAHIDSGASGTLTDLVNVTGTPPAGDNVTDSDTADVTTLVPEISVNKTANPTAGAPSTNVNFTINVTNTGDCTLNPVKVVDTLPAGMSYVAAGTSPLPSSVVGNTITWNNVGPLNAGASTLITLIAHIDSGASGTLTDLVNVTGTPPAGDNVTDSDTADVTTLVPEISVNKTANPTAGAPSTNVNFTINVTNTGDCTLNPVKVVDTLPAGMSYVAAGTSPLPSSVVGNTITWNNVGPLNAGASTVITLIAHIDSGASGTLTDLVNVTGTPPAGDNVTDSDTADVTTLVPEISVNKTANPTAGAPSTNVNFTINVTNTGDCTLNPVKVVDTLPAGMSYVAAGTSPLPSSVVGNTITWNNVGPLNAGASTVITLIAHIDSGASGTLTDLVNVTGTPPAGDNVTDSDTADVTTLVPEISVNKTANPTAGAPSTNVNFTINVTNTGDCTLNPVKVVDTLPAGMSYVVAGTSPLPSSVVGNNITWNNVGPLNAGASTLITLIAHIDSGASGTLTDLVNVTGTPPAGDNVTDSDTADVTTLAPEISVNKTANPTAGAPSTNVNFTINVTNTGDCTLNPVKVVDTLPAGMSYVSSSPTANTTGGTTIWDNVGPLTSSGGSKTLYLVAHIDSNATGILNNTVNVTGTPPAGDNVSDEGYAEVTTLEPAITVTKTASPSSGAPSTNVNFTIVVTNAGDSTLNPVKVVDTLPTGMSYVSSSPTANTTGGTTIWDNVGPLTSSGGSKTLYLVAHIDYGASGTLTDLVNATGTPPAGDNVTDSDTATVVVRPKPKPPVPPITRPQQAQYFSEKSSVQGVGEIFYEKTILASGVGVREYMWGNTGNGTFAMTITEILNEGVRLNCSGNCSDMGKIMDPIYGDDESPVMTNFECKKMVQFEIGAKDNPLIYGLEGEAIYSNPGFSGGMNAQVKEYYAVSSLQKDETVKMTTTATYNDTKRDWTNCQKARPYNANELNFDTKNAFTGSWGTDSSWTKVCSKDIKHHQYFEGEFQVDKNLMFQEEVTKPWPEKEPHGDC